MSSEWKPYKIGKLCSKVTSGGTPKSTNKAYYENGNIPWLNTKEVNFNRIYVTEKKITEEALANSSAKLIPKNSVIVAMYGASAGRIGINKIDLTTNQACCNLIINNEIADYNFIYYYLSHNTTRLLDLANGAAQQNLNSIIIKNYDINLPPLPEQKSIAHILSTLDDKIELNRKMNETLEQMAQALFTSWFVDFDAVLDNAIAKGNSIPDALKHKAERRKEVISFGKNKALPEELLELFPSSFEFNDELEKWIPEGWEVKLIEELCSKIQNGGTPKRDNDNYWRNGKIPWLTSGEVRQNIICKTKSFITEDGLKNSSAKWVEKLSTVIAMYGATAGQVALISDNFTTNQAICSLIPKDGFEYFNYLYLSNNVAYLENQARGSAQQNISKGIIELLKVVVPSEAILRAFHDTVESKFLKYIENTKQIETLIKQRDVLLPQLISGKLRVSEEMLEKVESEKMAEI